METKKTNLSLSADVTESEKLLELAHKIGPEICVLKTHIDILNDFTPSVTKKLMQLAAQHQFLIFEDRKFADIGNTVKHQYENGIYKIADWADIINAHILPGPGIIQGLASVGIKKERGLLLLAEMSSAGNLLTPDYAMKALDMAKQNADFVIGFISQHKLSDDANFIYMTPGIQLLKSTDALGQQYITPETAIIKNGTDIIIVGRAIIQSDHPLNEAKKYRSAGWNTYLKALHN